MRRPRAIAPMNDGGLALTSHIGLEGKMAATYTVDLTQRLLVTRLDGVVSHRDIGHLIARLLADPSVAEVTRHLVLSYATGSEDANLSELVWMEGQLRQALSIHPERLLVRSAVVAPHGLDFFLACVVESFTDVAHLPPVFSDVRSACAWLKIAVPPDLEDR